MNEILNDINLKRTKQQDNVLRECCNKILGREITPDDYKYFQLVSGIGMDQAIVYKGEKVGEIRTEITFTPNWDTFIDNSITCTCATTYKLL